MLSTRDLVFKERLVKKLTERYMDYIKLKLKLPTSIRIHLVVNISRVKRYRELMKRQRVEKLKPVEVSGVEEYEVEKIWNKQKVRGVIKYLVK